MTAARCSLSGVIAEATDDLHDIQAILTGLARLLPPGDSPDRLLYMATQRLTAVLELLDVADTNDLHSASLAPAPTHD